jgi:hypothetical protein
MINKFCDTDTVTASPMLKPAFSTQSPEMVNFGLKMGRLNCGL